jgi:hypothetical protein
MMRSTWCSALLAGVAFGALQAPALATTCYFVYDRSDTVIYRDAQPPVDMSTRGDAARDAMRQRGEYLLFFDTDRCAPLAFLTGPGTPGTLTVDQIVAGYPTMAASEEGIPANSAAPAKGGATTTRTVGVARGGVGMTRTQPAAPAKK